MEKCDRHDSCFDEIKLKLGHIEKLLMGNGKIGLAEMSRRSFEWIQGYKKTRNGRLDWAFRVMIMLVLSYIAVKVGIKR